MAFSFGNVGAAGGDKKTGNLFSNSTAPTGGLFSQSQQQQTQQSNATGPSLFGSTAAPQNNNSLFGQPQQQQNAGFSLFSQPQQQQQQQQQGQQQQQPNMGNSLFGTSFQPAPVPNNAQMQSLQQQREGLPQLRQSSAQPFAGSTMTGHSMEILISIATCC